MRERVDRLVDAESFTEDAVLANWEQEGFGADGSMLTGFAPYGATKAAVRYLSRALAREAKETGVLVATVDPGIVATDMLTAVYPTMQPGLRSISRILSQPVSAVAPRLARLMLANRRTGARLRAVGMPWVIWRLITAPFRAARPELEEAQVTRRA